MRIIKSIRLRIRSLFRRNRVEEELNNEMRDHLERQIQLHVSAGMSPIDARNAATREFGNIALIEEQCRDMRRVNYIEDTFRDFRFAIRTLSKSPGFLLTALGALALGIGANAAIFSVVDQILLNPAGVSHAERVVALRVKYDKLNLRSIPMSAPDFVQARDSRNAFEHVAIMSPGDYNYIGSGGAATAPERLQGAAVTVEWFDVFGAQPMIGRVFRPEEDQPEANQEVVLAYAGWKRLFGGDPQVAGRTMILNDRIYRVIGVMRPEFRWPREVELWTPLGLPAKDYGPDNTFSETYVCFAHLRPGLSFEQGNAWMQVLSDRVRRATGRGPVYARESGWGLFAIPLTDFTAGDTKKPLLILLGAVAFDPLTLAVTAAVLIGAAVVASYIPARRAMRVNPVDALRLE